MSDNISKFDLAVIMPVFNEAKYIGQTLDQLYQQDYPMDKIEVVVADGGSTDGTREIVESYKNRFGSLKLLENPVKKPSSGRNAGVKNSTAPYTVVIDGHVYLPSKKLFRDIIETFKTTEADCLCRPQPLQPPDLNEFELAVGLCRGSFLGHKPGSEIYSDFEGEVDPTSSGGMWTRDTFEKVGYFDEKFDACEDVDFNYRVWKSGLKSFLSPKLTIFYYPRSTLKGLWRQMFRYGLGRFRFAQKHSLSSPILWLAGAGVLFFALLFLLSFISTPFFELFKNVLGLYLLLVIFSSAYLSVSKKHLGCLLYGLLIFPTIHFGLGMGFLAGILEKFTGTAVISSNRNKIDVNVLQL
ncbi:MAG: glycosyltransferase family 2 protein [bacterium]